MDHSILLLKRVSILVSFLLLGSCFNPFSSWFPPDVPYQTSGDFIVYWVAPWGSDNNPGTKDEPLKTIQVAINKTRTEWREDEVGAYFRFEIAGGTYTPGDGLVDGPRYGVWFDPGVQTGDPFFMDLEFRFGWDRRFRERTEPVILDGQGQYEHVWAFTRLGNDPETISLVEALATPLPANHDVTYTFALTVNLLDSNLLEIRP